MKKSMILGLLLTASMQLAAAEIRRVTPIADDRSVKVEITLSAAANRKIPVEGRIAHSKSGEELCRFSREVVCSGAADSVKVVFVDGLAPELWSPSSPELYDLEIEVAGERFSRRIGFRRFEMRDGVFHLNGKPIYLRGNAINPPDRGVPPELERSREFARDYVRFMKSLNINIIRIPVDSNWLEVCDEEGMMVFAGRYGHPKHSTPSGPPADFDLSLRTYKDIDLGPFAPHPSVVIYVLSNEVPYSGAIGDRYRDFLSRMCRELKKWDDTRLYIGNTGYGLGRSADIYDVHRYWGWYYNSFLTYLNMRDKPMWQNPGRVQPITFTECVGNYTGIDGRFNLCSRTKQPGSQKCWTGHLPDSLQADAALRYQAFVLKQATELFRRLRCQNGCLAGTMPFTIMFHNWDGVASFAEMKPKPVAWQYQVSYQPVLLSWENWQTQVYAGGEMSVVAHVVNDDEAARDLDDAVLTWWIERDGKRFCSGEVAFPRIPYYGTDRRHVTVAVPSDLATGEYVLKGELSSKGEILSRNESEIFIAGANWRSKSESAKRVYLYETAAGEPSLRALRNLGFEVVEVDDIGVLPKSATLVLGRDSWDGALESRIPQLRRFVERGGRVVCLKQEWTRFNASWLPEGIKFLENSNNDPTYLSPTLAYCDGMNINLERPYHPVFEGLNPDMFRLWSDFTSFDESKAGFPAIYPVTGGYSLRGVDQSDIAILANYSRSLAATALSEIFIGKGSVLLSGFELVNRCGKDPVADRFLGNIVRYMTTARGHERHVVVGDTIVWGDYLSERGIVNAPCNGLMVNTVPIIPEHRREDERYILKIDEYGYHYAGHYGGWNSKPGVQYVPYGRRPMAPFTYSRGGNLIVDKGSAEGEGFFHVTLPERKSTMVTVLENPVDKPIVVAISLNDGLWKPYTLQPRQQLSVRSDISGIKRDLKVTLKGDRRVILVKTTFID